MLRKKRTVIDKDSIIIDFLHSSLEPTIIAKSNIVLDVSMERLM